VFEKCGEKGENFYDLTLAASKVQPSDLHWNAYSSLPGDNLVLKGSDLVQIPYTSENLASRNVIHHCICEINNFSCLNNVFKIFTFVLNLY